MIGVDIGSRDRAQVHATARVATCTTAGHRSATASPAAFVRATTRQYLWPADYSEPGRRLIGGRCEACGSDLAIEVAGDHPLVDEVGR
jgi:hypothetical protein